MSKIPKNMDLNQLAKRIVDEAIGNIEPEEELDEKKKTDPESGRLKENKKILLMKLNNLSTYSS